MGIMKKFFSQTKKPEGFLGKIMVNGMNSGGHSSLAEWGFGFIGNIKAEASLDCGCGGGANVRRLLERSDKAYGIDYSEISVAKSRETNVEAIRRGKCEILQGDVCCLPFENNSFDIVTAFETVYFWQNIENAFSEIYRVLKSGGIFAITNESTGTDKTSVKFSQIIDGMNLYTGEKLKSLLEKSGFISIEIHTHADKPWLNVTAKKAE